MSDMDIDRHLRAKIADLTAECQALRGERAVLVRLLRAADNVLDTLDPESDDESERLATLRQAIEVAARHQAG